MAQGNPMPGEKYLHFKNKLYQVIAIAHHSETGERCVVYQALYGDFGVCVRPYDMFISEVDHEKYPQVTQRYRFQYVGGLSGTEQPPDSIGQAASGTESVGETGATDGADPASGSQSLGEAVSPDGADLVNEPESMRGLQPTDGTEQAQPDPAAGIDPWLERFLDARDFDEKYQVVCAMKKSVTDRLIDDIAVVLDIVIPEGETGERYEQLKYCVRTRRKFESTHLR